MQAVAFILDKLRLIFTDPQALSSGQGILSFAPSKYLEIFSALTPQIGYIALWSLGNALKNTVNNFPRWLGIALMVILCFCLSACTAGVPSQVGSVKNKSLGITEVSPPVAIAKLAKLFDQYTPTVEILSPQPDQVLLDNKVAVKVKVEGLPIFKHPELGLGPHVHIALDGQEYKALYDPEQSLTFENLSPGTHTLRAFASRPWHESFKNKTAYDQVTFHIFTPTVENLPQPDQPLLTYSRPVGKYGAEPVMLDFYIHNPSLAQAEVERIPDWRVRVTVNGETFVTDQWQPVYLKGLNVGRNWVKLELIDRKGLLIPNAYSSTAHLFTYQPNGTDTLSRLTRGEVIPNLEAIADPNYVPPAVAEEPKAVPETKQEATPTPTATVPPPTPPEKVEASPVTQVPQELPANLEASPVTSVPEPTATPSPTPAPKKPKKIRLKVRKPTPFSESTP